MSEIVHIEDYFDEELFLDLKEKQLVDVLERLSEVCNIMADEIISMKREISSIKASLTA